MLSQFGDLCRSGEIRVPSRTRVLFLPQKPYLPIDAAVTISGIELAEKIKKGQFKTGKFGGCRATMSEMWSAVLAV